MPSYELTRNTHVQTKVGLNIHMRNSQNTTRDQGGFHGREDKSTKLQQGGDLRLRRMHRTLVSLQFAAGLTTYYIELRQTSSTRSPRKVINLARREGKARGEGNTGRFLRVPHSPRISGRPEQQSMRAPLGTPNRN